MSDIVEELKNRYMDTKRMIPCDLEHRAAQEIESLRQRLEMAEACLAGDNALIVGLKNDIADKEYQRVNWMMQCKRQGDNAQILINELRQQLSESEAERLEQARLLGMSGEREANLLAQLADTQLREQRLLEILGEAKPLVLDWCNENGGAGLVVFAAINKALALPQDTTALDRIKAGYEAQIQQLREGIEAIQDYAQEVIDRRVQEWGEGYRPKALQAMRDDLAKAQKALAIPADTSALDKIKAQVAHEAGEVMRERCSEQCAKSGAAMAWGCAAEIRAIPGVTMEDLK